MFNVLASHWDPDSLCRSVSSVCFNFCFSNPRIYFNGLWLCPFTFGIPLNRTLIRLVHAMLLRSNIVYHWQFDHYLNFSHVAWLWHTFSMAKARLFGLRAEMNTHSKFVQLILFFAIGTFVEITMPNPVANRIKITKFAWIIAIGCFYCLMNVFRMDMWCLTRMFHTDSVAYTQKKISEVYPMFKEAKTNNGFYTMIENFPFFRRFAC